MNVARYWAVVTSSWRLIGLFGLAGLLVGAFFAFTTTPQYQATAGVYFYTSGGDSASQLAQGSTYAQNQVRSYAVLAQQPVVLEPVIKELNLPYTSIQLARTITTDVPLDTVILEIIVTNPSAQESANIANAVAKQIGLAVEALSPTGKGAAGASVKASTVAPAQVPQFPISPNRRLDLAGGLLGGLLIGVIVAVVRELADNRVRSPEVVAEITDLPVVGDVLDDPDTDEHALASQEQDDPRSEAFRKLAANFEFVCYDKTVRTMIVTSANHNEGKSVTAVNLAYAISLHMRVILVDVDLRDPSISVLTGLPNEKGVTTVLTDRDTLDDALQATKSASLRILTSGPAPPNSAQLLGSANMKDLLTQLASRCDLVVIDTPPVLPASDAPVIARLVDGVLVIANAKKTKRRQLADALEQLRLSGGLVLGIVLNQTNSKSKAIDSEKRPTIG